MADNINITPGAGKTVAADDISDVYYQKVKLIDGTTDSTTIIAVDVGAKANALRIAPANDITDGTYIGDIKFGEAETNSAAILADTTDIKTAIELLDNAVDGNYLNANLNIAGTDVSANAGVLTAQTLRVTIATDDECNNFLGTIDADTGAIKLAVEIMDDWDDGDKCKVITQASTNTIEVVGDAANNAAVAGNPVAIGVLYDSTKPTVLNDGDVGYALGDSYGRLLAGVEPEWFNEVYDSADATAEAEVVKAATASKKIYITSFVISSDVEGWAKLQDEDSNALTGKFWLKAGGGVSWTAGAGAPLVLNVVNKALEVIVEAAGGVGVTVTGYLAP